MTDTTEYKIIRWLTICIWTGYAVLLAVGFWHGILYWRENRAFRREIETLQRCNERMLTHRERPPVPPPFSTETVQVNVGGVIVTGTIVTNPPTKVGHSKSRE